MKQTDIKTIYLTALELKNAIANFVEKEDPELAQQMAAYDCQLSVKDEGMVIRIIHEFVNYDNLTLDHSELQLSELQLDE